MAKKVAVKKKVSSAKNAANKASQDKLEAFVAKPEPKGVEPLDPDFVAEWMAEQEMKKGEDWEELRPGYSKEYCEVRTKDGVEVGPCFPNGGKFTRLDGEQEILESEVTHVRYYEQNDMGRDEEEDGEGEYE